MVPRSVRTNRAGADGHGPWPPAPVPDRDLALHYGDESELAATGPGYLGAPVDPCPRCRALRLANSPRHRPSLWDRVGHEGNAGIPSGICLTYGAIRSPICVPNQRIAVGRVHGDASREWRTRIGYARADIKCSAKPCALSSALRVEFIAPSRRRFIDCCGANATRPLPACPAGD